MNVCKCNCWCTVEIDDGQYICAMCSLNLHAEPEDDEVMNTGEPWALPPDLECG